MAITTQNAKNNIMSSNPFSLAVKLTTAGVVLALFAPRSYADLNVAGSAESELVYQETDSETLGYNDFTSLLLKPAVGVSYSSKTLNGAVNGSVTHIERDGEAYSGSDTYEEYSYNVQWEPVENLLTLSATGGLNYQAANAADYLIADFVSNADNLAKAKRNSVSALLSATKGDWVEVTGRVGYSEVDADGNAIGLQRLAVDNENYSASVDFANGEAASNVHWNVGGSYNASDRSTASTGDFVTGSAYAYVDVILLDNFGTRFAANHDTTEISSTDNTATRDRKYSSYGFGLVYRQSGSRYLAVTANVADSSEGEQDGETFIGVDFQWALSRRTSLSAVYGRGVYGGKAVVDFDYVHKHFNVRLSYNEDVTSYSRLVSDPELVGVFVCPSSASSFDDCFKPSDPNYQLGEDEALYPITDENLQLEDEVIFRSSGSAHFGYSFSKLRLGLTLRYAEDDYLESEQLRESASIGTNAVYSLGRRTKASANIGYADIDYSVNGSSRKSQNWNASVALRRELGRSLSSSIELSYINKQGDYSTDRYGANYEDRRISVGIRYAF